MWKPVNGGLYRYCNALVRVVYQCSDRFGFLGASVYTQGSGTESCVPVWDGPWSLPSPDARAGTISPEALETWAHWAIWDEFGALTCATLTQGSLAAYLEGDAGVIVRCAKIQPDWKDGPLWVPWDAKE